MGGYAKGERERVAVIYARVSTARQADDGLPVESQLEQCHAKAKALGARVVRVFKDEGISGRTTRRPAFMEAMDYCEQSRVDLFICWSTSRFARNRVDAALHKRTLERLGTRLVYVSQDFGEHDDAWLTEAIIEVIDEQYSRTIAKDTRRSMAKNAADGFWNGGIVPFGFEAVPAGKRRKLAVVESEAVIVRTMFRWYLDGDGCKEISNRLNSAGLLRRGARWSKNTVANVITNPAMKGCVSWTDRGEQIITPAHEPIVRPEEFDTVLQMMGSRAPRNVGGRPKSEAVFSGILRCGYCGEAMLTESATGRAGKRYHYYNCRSWLKGIGCESRRVPVETLDGSLVSAVCDLIFTPATLRALVVELRQQSSEFERLRQDRIDAVATELADVERRLRRLYESIEADAGLNLADIAPRLRELRARQETLKRAAESVAAEVGPAIGTDDHDLHRAAVMFRELVQTTEEPAKVRAFMGHIVKKASIRGHQVALDYWPESIVNAIGGSQCVVSWLPARATGRTRRICVSLPLRAGRKDAA